jgi:hypothetical protein
MSENEKDWGFGDEKMRQQPIGGGSMKRPRNFWIPPNKQDKFVFLDSKPYYTDETDDRGTEEKTYRVAYLTVVRLWTSDRDNKVRISKDLFRMKRRTEEYFHQQSNKRQGLRGCEYEASRQDDKSPSVGGQFDFEGKLTDAEIIERFGQYLGFLKKQTPEEYLKGYDYPKVLALPVAGKGDRDKGENGGYSKAGETHAPAPSSGKASNYEEDVEWHDWRGGPVDDGGSEEPPPF